MTNLSDLDEGTTHVTRKNEINKKIKNSPPRLVLSPVMPVLVLTSTFINYSQMFNYIFPHLSIRQSYFESHKMETQVNL